MNVKGVKRLGAQHFFQLFNGHGKIIPRRNALVNGSILLNQPARIGDSTGPLTPTPLPPSGGEGLFRALPPEGEDFFTPLSPGTGERGGLGGKSSQGMLAPLTPTPLPPSGGEGFVRRLCRHAGRGACQTPLSP